PDTFRAPRSALDSNTVRGQDQRGRRSAHPHESHRQRPARQSGPCGRRGTAQAQLQPRAGISFGANGAAARRAVSVGTKRFVGPGLRRPATLLHRARYALIAYTVRDERARYHRARVATAVLSTGTAVVQPCVSLRVAATGSAGHGARRVPATVGAPRANSGRHREPVSVGIGTESLSKAQALETDKGLSIRSGGAARAAGPGL